MGGILATITAIAGIYGMNFQYMPEPTGATATPVLAAMLAGALVLHRAFKRNHWL